MIKKINNPVPSKEAPNFSLLMKREPLNLQVEIFINLRAPPKDTDKLPEFKEKEIEIETQETIGKGKDKDKDKDRQREINIKINKEMKENQ